MAAGSVFRFLHEPPIAFAPTYKFDKADPSPLAYDSSEKARVPAWTDRIFFRGSEITRTAHQASFKSQYMCAHLHHWWHCFRACVCEVTHPSGQERQGIWTATASCQSPCVIPLSKDVRFGWR